MKQKENKRFFYYVLGCSLSLCIPCICGYLMPLPSFAIQATPVTTADSGQSLYDKAQKLFQEKNYKQAKDSLNQLVAKYPMGDFIPKARLLLANLQEDFTVSTVQFRELATEYSARPEGEEAQKDLGSRYYLADKYDEAADSYKEFLDHYPKSNSMPEVRYWYASSLLALDKNQEALDEYQKVLNDSPDSPWAPKALLGTGNAYFKMKKYQDAEKRYLKILDQYHFYDEMNLVYLKLGQTYESEQKWKEAHAAYQTLIQQYPQAFEVSEARGRLQELEKEHADLPPAAEAQAPEPTATPVVVASEPTVTPVPTETAQEAAPETDAISKPFHVQVGVYSKKLYVDKAQKGVRKAGYKPYVVTVKAGDMPYPMYKVRVGDFADKVSAQKFADELTKKLKEKAIVVED